MYSPTFLLKPDMCDSHVNAEEFLINKIADIYSEYCLQYSESTKGTVLVQESQAYIGCKPPQLHFNTLSQGNKLREAYINDEAYKKFLSNLSITFYNTLKGENSD